MKPIAHIRTDFKEKFGIPRQAGLAAELTGRIVFEPEYRNPDALRGLEGFDYIWLIWEFSEVVRAREERPGEAGWSPTVRPPRLGGNTRIGVFASRSPFRPNPIGLSSLKLERVDYDTPEGPQVIVKGADLMDGTPIYDIKPYIPYADSHPDAAGGFTEDMPDYHVSVVIPDDMVGVFTAEQLAGLKSALAEDPRPAYQRDPDRIYTFTFADREVSFSVNEGVLAVTGIK